MITCRALLVTLAIATVNTLASSPGKSAIVDRLFAAVRNDDVEGVQVALKHPGVSIDFQQPETLQTPLMAACLSGSSKVVKYLLKQGSDVSIPEKDGYTPMHGAAFQGRPKVAKILVKAGLDPSQRHGDGFTPIHRACWGGTERHAQTIKVLLDAGVSPFERAQNRALPIDMVKGDASRRVLRAAMATHVHDDL